MQENSLPPGRPLAGLRLAILGPGRVGASFACWSVALGADVVAIAGRRRVTAERHGLESVVDLSATWCPPGALDPSAADVLLVCVADPAIETVAGELAARPPAPVVLHASGLHDARVLAALAPRSAVGSLHPLRAFAAASTRVEDARGTWFAVDGDPEALAVAERLARAFGGTPFPIDGERRLLYHLAASLAAGGVTTVLSMVDELVAGAGLPPELFAAYLGLTRSALEPLEAGRPAPRAITGPMARGDTRTVDRQLAALHRSVPELDRAARALMLETGRQTRRPTASDDATDASLDDDAKMESKDE